MEEGICRRVIAFTLDERGVSQRGDFCIFIRVFYSLNFELGEDGSKIY